MIKLWKSKIHWTKKIFSYINSVFRLSFISKRRKKRIIGNIRNSFKHWRIKMLFLCHNLFFRWKNLIIIWRIFRNVFYFDVSCRIHKVINWRIHIVTSIKMVRFLKSKPLKLAFSYFSFDNFFLGSLSIWAMTEIFNIRLLKRCSWILIKLFFDHVNTSKGWLIVLPLYYCRFVFFVHALDGRTSVSLEILITGFDWVFDVDNLLLPEVFKI